MMNAIALIAGDEVRYWRRSKIAWSVLVTLLLISICAALVSNTEASRRTEERLAQQSEADAIFQAQPDRHPHRMVHYGHYVYRTASPLAVIDAGIDSMVGTSMFLEGHRQNSATFAAAKETGLLARFGSFSPAFALQVLAPLLLIICGFASVTREKENKTLYQLIGQGVSNSSLLLGKSLALWALALLALLPLLLLGFSASGDQIFGFRQSFYSMAFGYLIYLSIWVLLIISVSALSRTSTQSLSCLLCLWIITAVLMPRVASEVAGRSIASPSQVETTLRVAQTMRTGGDSHEIEDMAFADLRSVTLAEYDVENIEDLPFNYRGLVALRGEEADTEILKQFAEERMELELQQKSIADTFSLLSPVVAIRSYSMALAGTALQDHHHFLRAAENYRYNMVQTFNRLQMSEMTLAEDLARNNDDESGQRTRVDSSHWTEMPVFELQPLDHDLRWQAASLSGFTMGLWLLAAFFLLLVSSRRLHS
jgi:ABC-2 type transport system permease protein